MNIIINLIKISTCLIILVACQSKTSPEQEAKFSHPEKKTLQKTDASQPSADVIAFVEANYGERDSADKNYIQEDTHYSICAYRLGPAPQKYHFLAVCGDNDLDPEKQVDLYVLRNDASDSIASNTGLSAQAPNVSVIELNHEPGFLLSKSEIHQGIIIGSSSIYKIVGNEIIEVANFIDTLDNRSFNDCEHSEHGCEIISRKLAPPSSSSTDLNLIERKNTNGSAKERRYELKFDSATKKYLIPEELQRSY